ncbi:glycosyltransferase [Thiohalorhabdus sp. Cl-TMA]|uniref:Glycosyltransferase n=1 Tax=Thiohalorhabdus methylotrophus TaxID=3242694 RepID=A0ABV4TU25_9GAMM
MEWLVWLLSASGAAVWGTVLLHPARPWGVRERLEAPNDPESAELGDVTAVIPARDEAACIGRTLRALERQGTGLRILVVDDGSRDGTARAARQAASGNVEVVPAGPLPAGWQGKLWALEQGVRRAGTPYLLFLDADIELAPGLLPALRTKLRVEHRCLVSLMATLRMENGWERLLLPAFVFFFKLLYPFALVNRRRSRMAGAAGGCMLLDAEALGKSGGLEAIRNVVIDDCTLARHVQEGGGTLWLGLSRSVRSRRSYRRLADIRDMVARTAFSQLRYSAALLVVASLVLVAVCWGPLLGLAAGSGPGGRLLGVLGLLAMVGTYFPTLRFYGFRGLRALTLPLAGTLFLTTTWASAWRYWRGIRTRWKGRTYGREAVGKSESGE